MMEVEFSLMEVDRRPTDLVFPLTDLERSLRDFVFPLMEDKFPLMEDKFSVTALEILPSSFSSRVFISGNDKSHHQNIAPETAKNM